MFTLMAVHAHPDDEATSTGGILARYSAEGVRTVVVTCTNGELGDGPAGSKPGEPGHDVDAVVAVRRGELQDSCDLLGVTHVETLGYRDSGMIGWETNHAPGAFWGMDVAEAAAPLVELIRRYSPDVLVTYDENGFYGHPDHIQAHRITMAAVEAAGSDAKVYWSTVRRSSFARFGELMREAGADWDEQDGQEMPTMGVEDDAIGATVDCAAHARAKRDALAAHASQSDAAFFLALPIELFTELLGVEEFVRVRPPAQPGIVETDLFAGRRAAPE